MFDHSANGPDCWKCSLSIEWHDCSFCPAIRLRQGLEVRRGAAARPLPEAALLPHPLRRQNLAQPMKKIGNRKSPVRPSSAFTLIELLVVISIIGLLAAMLLPAVGRAKVAAQKMKAKTEISGLVAAIEGYDQDYGRFPMTQAEQTWAGTNDSTTGLMFGSMSGFCFGNNSNVVAILMDLQAFGNGVTTMNANHVYNPKQVHYLTATVVSDPTLPGVGPDGVYRDPWGNPYVITMNASFNEQGTKDILYSLASVSKQNGSSGYNGLFNPTGTGDNYLYHGKVMVWSAGPDGKYDAGPASGPNVGANKDNVLSWQ